MKVFKRTIIFIICFVIFFGMVEKLFWVPKEDHVWNIIYDTEQEDIDMLFVGSSLFFRNIDTPLINETTGLQTLILGVGNNNLTVAKNDLELALEKKNVKVVVLDAYLGLNYLQYSNSNKGVLINHNDAIPSFVDRIKSNFVEFGLDDAMEASFQVFRSNLMWDRWNMSNKNVSVTENYGYAPLYEIKEGLLDKDYTINMMWTDCNKVKDDEELPEGTKTENAFREIIQLAKEHGCAVWVVSMPRCDSSFKNKECGQVLRLFQIAKEEGSERCIDLNKQLKDIELEISDFRDKRHLNVNGARKTTRYLLEKYISEEMGIEEIEYPYYVVKEESVEYVESDKYQYKIETYGECAYRFFLHKNGKLEKEWESSLENYIVLDAELTAEERLYYEVLDVNTGEVLLKDYFIKVNQ